MKRNWTENEIRYLKDHIGRTRISTIANNLGRTEKAVLIKMKRLGIANTKEHAGMLTTGELAEILQVDRTTIRGWIERHGLPIKKRVTRMEKTFVFVDNEEFWEWAKNHKDKVDFSRIERNIIPPEPEWVEPLRYRNHYYRKRDYRYWTTKENARLKEMLNKGYPKSQIAEALGRSVVSVERKIARIENESRNELWESRYS